MARSLTNPKKLSQNIGCDTIREVKRLRLFAIHEAIFFWKVEKTGEKFTLTKCKKM